VPPSLERVIGPPDLPVNTFFENSAKFSKAPPKGRKSAPFQALAVSTAPLFRHPRAPRGAGSPPRGRRFGACFRPFPRRLRPAASRTTASPRETTRPTEQRSNADPRARGRDPFEPLCEKASPIGRRPVGRAARGQRAHPTSSRKSGGPSFTGKTSPVATTIVDANDFALAARRIRSLPPRR
jgi:hypothetical protein